MLGGGLGAITAAFYLTDPSLDGKYEVTVYQQGWRLGGKGASGRNPRASQRIEEHGLHMFLGFYDNAFGLMRACVDEWERPPDHPWAAGLPAMFHPQRLVSVQEYYGGAWETWNVRFPPLPGEPGLPAAPLPTSPLELVELVATELDRRLRELRSELGPAGSASRLPSISFDGVLQALRGADPLAGAVANALLLAAQEAAEALDDLLRILGSLERPLVRRLVWGLQLGIAVARGLAHDVVGRDWDAINHYELREWLELHGAEPHITAWAPVRALYDLGFAYAGGDDSTIENGRIAAGVGVKILLKMILGYRGAPLWRMTAGMGDTLFTPLYEVLRKRGVNFAFFHRVRSLKLNEAGDAIDAIVIDRQAATRSGGLYDYDPLVDVKGLGCWPSEPLWSRLDTTDLPSPRPDYESAWDDSRVERRTLKRGAEFDQVVLGIPVGALREICADLIAARSDWAEMLEIPTTATQAVQLWFEPKLQELGWDAGPTVMTAYAQPLESWGEMTEVLAREDWRGPHPRSVQYLCSAMQDPAGPRDADYPVRAKARVKRMALNWLETSAAHLWPAVVPKPPGPGPRARLPAPRAALKLPGRLLRAAGAIGRAGRRDGLLGATRHTVRGVLAALATAIEPDRGFDYGLLVDPQDRRGRARFDAQYWRANVNPSDRYVQSFPGSIRRRLPAGGSGFDNLYLAGDWVRTGVNAGSAESAVQGGMQAAKALSGVPAEIVDEV